MTRFDATTRVQDNTKSAAVAAGFLLFFGFFYGLQIPQDDDVFSISGALFIYALRLGGLLMAGIAVWCATGHAPALLTDGIAGVAIGIALAATGIGMILGGGDWLQTLINVVCGALFVSSGLRNVRDFFLLEPIIESNAAQVVDEWDVFSGGDSRIGSLVTERPPTAKSSPNVLRSGNGDDNIDARVNDAPDLIELSPKAKAKTSRSGYTAGGGRFAASDDAISLSDLAGEGREKKPRGQSPPDPDDTRHPPADDDDDGDLAEWCDRT